jgi:hypothetical protein
MESSETKKNIDVNGQELRRGDHVRLSVAMLVLDPSNTNAGVGQVHHVFSDSIHAMFQSGMIKGNSGLCFEKVTI